MQNKMLFPAVLGAAMLVGGGAFAQGGQTASGTTPQQRAAHQAEAAGMDREVQQLLGQAEQAISAGNWTQAREFAGRAETSWLNRKALQGGQPQAASNGAFGQLRDAIGNRDRNEARRALQSAMSEYGRGDMATGADTSRMPQQGAGGAAGMQQGQQMQHGMPHGAAGGSPHTMPHGGTR